MEADLKKIYVSTDVCITEDRFLILGDRIKSIETTTFVYNIQHANKSFQDPLLSDYSQKKWCFSSVVCNLRIEKNTNTSAEQSNR